MASDLTLEDFGVDYDNGIDQSADVAHAIDVCRAEKRTLTARRGEVFLGNWGTSVAIFPFDASQGFQFDGNGVRFKLNSRSNPNVPGAVPTVFQPQNPNDLYMHGFTVADAGADMVLKTGAVAVQPYLSGGVQCRGLDLDFNTDGAQMWMQTAGDAASIAGAGALLRGARLRGLTQNTYYGLSTQNNVEELKAELTTYNAGRTYFPYGAHKHEVDLFLHHDGSAVPAANQAILLDADYKDGVGNTVRAWFSGDFSRYNYGVGLQTKMLPGGGDVRRHREYDLWVSTANITNFGIFTPYVLWAFDGQTLLPVTSSRFSPILFDGQLENCPGDLIHVRSIPAVRGTMNFGPGMWRGFDPFNPVDVPGFAVRDASGRAMYTLNSLRGDANFNLPVRVDGIGFSMEIEVIISNNDAYWENSVIGRWVVTGYGASGWAFVRECTPLWQRTRGTPITVDFVGSGSVVQMRLRMPDGSEPPFFWTGRLETLGNRNL